MIGLGSDKNQLSGSLQCLLFMKLTVDKHVKRNKMVYKTNIGALKMFSVFFTKAIFKKSRWLGKVSRKKIAVLMDFVHITSAYEVYIL